MKITFCGHEHFFADEFLEKRVIMLLEEKIGNCDAEIFLGGYGEFDSFAHRICWKYKQTHPKVSIALVIPYLDREKNTRHRFLFLVFSHKNQIVSSLAPANWL